MKMFLVLSLLLSFQSAWSLPLNSWKMASVKISSFPCLTEAPRFEGSGLVFIKNAQVYVITSEHVLIHDQGASTCHRVRVGRGNEQKAELMSADFFAGLALLRIPNPDKNLLTQAIDWQNLQTVPVPGPLTALGYPVGAADLVSLTGGTLLTAQSHRALIAGIPEMIEAARLPVEYGMSGGLLLSQDNDNGLWMGILSHQILRREAGRVTVPGDIDPGVPSSENDLTLAIPSAQVLAWIEKQFASSPKLAWLRNAPAQIAQQESLQYGALLFTLKNRKAQDIWDVGGILHGGSDGSGIGGDNNPQAENLEVIEISFLPGASVAQRSLILENTQLEQWRQWLLAGKKVSAVFLKSPDAQRLGRIQSLSQFLTLWQRDSYLPLVLRSRDQQGSADADLLMDRAATVGSLAQQARDQSSVLEKKAWFGLLRDKSVATQNALTSSAEMAALLDGENDRYWREFYDQDFDQAVALESALQSLIAQMRKMGL